MNSQFQKLAEQAGMYVDLDGKPWPKWMGAEECEQAYARFAELIVRECAEVAYKRSVHSGPSDILKHFGVDE
jgi:hypothetical protein